MPAQSFGVVEYTARSISDSGQGDFCLLEINNGPRGLTGSLRMQFAILTAPWIKLPATGTLNARTDDNNDRIFSGTGFCSREHFNHVYALLHNERSVGVRFVYEGPQLSAFSNAGFAGAEEESGTRKLTQFMFETGKEPVGEIEELLERFEFPGSP